MLLQIGKTDFFKTCNNRLSTIYQNTWLAHSIEYDDQKSSFVSKISNIQTDQRYGYKDIPGRENQPSSVWISLKNNGEQSYSRKYSFCAPDNFLLSLFSFFFFAVCSLCSKNTFILYFREDDDGQCEFYSSLLFS